jgi:hypothetical protein
MDLESRSVNNAQEGQSNRKNHDHGAHDQDGEYGAAKEAASWRYHGLDNASVFYAHGDSNPLVI